MKHLQFKITCLLLFSVSINFISFAADLAVFDMTGRNGEIEKTERQLYSAQYLADISGISYLTTSNLQEALEHSIILLSSPISNNSFTAAELETICSWVKEGGVVMSPALTTFNSLNSASFAELFGISTEAKPEKSSARKLINWNPDYYADRELEYFDEPEERETSIGTVKSYSVSPNGCDVLANFSDGQAAVVRNRLEKGTAYLIGVAWRDVVQRNQLNKDQNSSRRYNNGFEPSSDIWALFLRSVYTASRDVAVWKFTVPGGFTQLLVPTHDCDSRTAYDAMHFMSDYEKSMNCKGHYFLTTHYFSDKINFGHSYLADFYNEESIPKARALLEAGHTVGSHSVCHFPDFYNVRNTDIVSKESYAKRATCVDGVSTGASTWAELVLSKQILETDLSNNVRSFRSGHLCVNPDIPETLENNGYHFQSCYTAGDLLSEFPFFGRLTNTWEGELSTVLTIPLHISDVYNSSSSEGSLSDNNWEHHPCLDQWETAMKKLRGNYASAVILIHPNRDWKMELEKRLVGRLDSENVKLYNFEEYGDFWLSRHNCHFTFEYEPASATLTIQTSNAEEIALRQMPFAVDTYDSIEKAYISDTATGNKMATVISRIDSHRLLVVPTTTSVGGNAIEDITGENIGADFDDSIYDIAGRRICTDITDLPKGIYIMKINEKIQKIKI